MEPTSHLTPGSSWVSNGHAQEVPGSQHLCSSLRFASPLPLPSSISTNSQEGVRSRHHWRSKVRTRGQMQRPPQTKGRTQFCPAHVTAAYVRLPICVVQILPITRHSERILEPFENLATAGLSRIQAFCSMGACVQQTQVGHCSCKKWTLCVRKQESERQGRRSSVLQ